MLELQGRETEVRGLKECLGGQLPSETGIVPEEATIHHPSDAAQVVKGMTTGSLLSSVYQLCLSESQESTALHDSAVQ